MDNQEFCVLFIQLNHDSMDNLDELLKLFPGETITSIIEKALKIFVTDTPVKKVKKMKVELSKRELELSVK